jgi:hypothetical protein
VGASLTQLIQDDDLFRSDSTQIPMAYGQAWALVHFLIGDRPEAFFEYLRTVARGRPGGPEGSPARAARRLELFREAFGDDLRTLERTWHAYMNRLN